MGKLEKEVKKQIRVTKVKKIILQTVAAAGVLSVALLVPNALQLFKFLPKNNRYVNDKRIYINKSRERLVKEGLLKYNNKSYLELTDFGKRILRQYQSNNYTLSKPKKWDGKWRMLVFDISEKRKETRDKVRRTLISIGFVRLQNSVWVYPYDCEDLITLLKADFKIGKDLLYVIADKIENDKVLRLAFDL